MKNRRSGKLGFLAVVPAVGAALMPKLVCPACWPAYAALVSALGLGFLINAQNLLIISTIFLGLALGTLFIQGKAKKSYKPFWLAIFSSFLILAGKFAVDNLVIVYSGAVLLTIAAILGLFPKKQKQTCAACETEQNKGGKLS